MKQFFTLIDAVAVYDLTAVYCCIMISLVSPNIALYRKIYQNGIFIVYHNGIILSRGIVKKGVNMEFRLKELRKRRNISQLKLALDLNMNQNSISRYENMEREADYKTLIKFADYFGVSLDYLLGRTDN